MPFLNEAIPDLDHEDSKDISRLNDKCIYLLIDLINGKDKKLDKDEYLQIIHMLVEANRYLNTDGIRKAVSKYGKSSRDKLSENITKKIVEGIYNRDGSASLILKELISSLKDNKDFAGFRDYAESGRFKEIE